MAGTIGYYAVQRKGRERPTSILVPWFWGNRPLRALIWSAPNRIWKYDPTAVGTWMYEDDMAEDIRELDRAEAERIAREDLGTELPSEDEIRRMCEEGARARGG